MLDLEDAIYAAINLDSYTRQTDELKNLIPISSSLMS